MKMRHYLRNCLLCFLAATFFISCSKETEQPMRIGMHVWPGFEPLFLARHLNYMTEKDFRLVEFSNGSEAGRAFRNGTLEAACITLDETFYLIQDGLDPVIILVLDESRGADAVLANPSITSLPELKGQRIAVEASAVEAYVLSRCLEKANLKIDEITPVYLPLEKHVLAYQENQVDAVVTYEPVRSKLIDLGAVELFNSTMIPGEIVDVLVVRREYFEKNPQRIEALKRAWFAALDELKRNPSKSSEVIAAREQVSPEAFENSLSKIHFPDEQECQSLLEGNPPKLLESAERLKKLMLESNLLRENISLTSLFESLEIQK